MKENPNKKYMHFPSFWGDSMYCIHDCLFELFTLRHLSCDNMELMKSLLNANSISNFSSKPAKYRQNTAYVLDFTVY